MSADYRQMYLRVVKAVNWVSAYDDRSTNRQLLKWIREMIASFEQEHGEIPYPPEEEICYVSGL